MERLIQCIRDKPCLWDIELEEYKSSSIKDVAWKEVVKECGFTDVKEARCIWKRLRDGHRQAIKKMTSKSGNPNIVWKYEKQMDFLLPTMKSRQPRFSAEWLKEENRYVDISNTIEESSDSDDLQSEESYVVPTKRATLSQDKEQSVDSDILRKKDMLKTSENALDNFFMSMLLTTRDLPERLQLRVQRQIFNSVMEAKEESLTTPSSCWAASSISEQ